MSAPVHGKGGNAVRASKRPRLSDGQPWQKLELFPTPPWATRALEHHVLMDGLATSLTNKTIWEPCAGLGHMAYALNGPSRAVYASDIYNYFTGEPGVDARRAKDALDFLTSGERRLPDWIITNPPFGDAEVLLKNFMALAVQGVALLCRLQWLESEGRYRNIFTQTPPSLIAPFVERVAMCEGGFDPAGSTATAYAWFVWVRDEHGQWPRHLSGLIPSYLIPPGCKKRLTWPGDAVWAAVHVPGFVPPSQLKKLERAAAKKAADALCDEIVADLEPGLAREMVGPVPDPEGWLASAKSEIDRDVLARGLVLPGSEGVL